MADEPVTQEPVQQPAAEQGAVAGAEPPVAATPHFKLRLGDGNEIDVPQAELDRVVGARLAREREKYADYETLKERAAKLDEIEQQNKTEFERAQERADQLERENTSLKEAQRELRVGQIVLNEASKRDIVDPDAALKLLDRDSLTFDESGAPTNVGDLLDGLVKDKPWLARKGAPAGSFDGGARPAPAPDLNDEPDPKRALGRGILQHLDARAP